MATKKTSKKATATSTDNKKSSKKSKFKSILKKTFLGFLIIGVVCFVIGLGYIFAIIKSAPALDVNNVMNLSQPSLLFDDKGNFIDNVPTEEERYVIKIDQMPKNLTNAFVAIEDERFYSHNGIDVRRIVGAAVNDVISIVTGKGGLHGASTLTQQLIKNTLLTNEVSIERKVKEIYLALKLEKRLTKDQILETYLNTIPLGGMVYGVEAASLYYFGKPAKDLTLIECAYLAGITQAPTTYSAYNPDNKDNPLYIDRTKSVLMKMEDLGFITQEEYDAAYAEVDQNKFVFKAAVTDEKLNQEWFARPAVDQVKKHLKEKYNYTDEEVDKQLVTGGLKIYTTMDKDLQEFTQATLNEKSNLSIGNAEEFTEENVPKLQASAVIMDYRTGYVKALVGGRGEQPPHSLNRAYFDTRSIGSTTKPLTVFGPGIDTKKLTAASVFDDAPLPPTFQSKYGGYNPQNWNYKYGGLTTSRESIRNSINTTSVQAADYIGLETSLEYGQKLGLVYNNDSKTAISSLALGEFNNAADDRDGGNTYKLAAAFGTFGNGGVYTEPLLYTKVVNATGKVILEGKPKTREVYSPQAAYIMYDLLKEPVKFDARPAVFSDIPVAGKTGTTTDVKDFWFGGLTPYYSGAVWIGYDIPQPMNGYSSSASNLWGILMGKAHEGLTYKELTKPDGIVTAAVCKDSGKKPTNLCSSDPRGGRVINEMFIDGTAPSEYCDVHASAKVNKENDKLVGPNTPSGLIIDRVFIKKKYPHSGTADYKYVYPTATDDSKPKPKPDTNNNNNNGNGNGTNNGNNPNPGGNTDSGNTENPGDNTETPPQTGNR